ncbi:MAG: PAS sensor protein [Spirochaetes bacterium]|nr:PAS sensor protein [Spirochaetota bacterium]
MDQQSKDLESIIEAFGTIGAALTICDKDLVLLYMNDKSGAAFDSQGGLSLVGSNLEACHKPESVAAMRKMLTTEKPNVYTVFKQGSKKLIWQGVWKSGGSVGGLVEISIPLPDEIPHFDRG